MKFTASLLALLFLSCQIPPPPPPEIIVQRDDFNLFANHWELTTFSGSTSYFDTSTAVLSGTFGSGWIYTPESYELPGLVVEIGLTQVSNDWCVELSPTLDASAPNGFYNEPTRVRAYIFDPLHRLHFEYKKQGVLLVNQEIIGAFSPVPARVRLRFTLDSLYFDYFSVDWKQALALRENWQGRWHFALSSASSRGVSKVDYAIISGPAKNFEEPPEVFDIELLWNRNPEPDVQKYGIHKFEIYPQFGTALRWYIETPDTFVSFSQTPKGRFRFFVEAWDANGNRSAPSDTVEF